MSATTMTAELVSQLFHLESWTVVDVDTEGRILAGNDATGSLQLVEIAPDGTQRRITDLPSRCTGRYVPGRRQVIVQHDAGGNEKMQLSILDLDDSQEIPALRPLIHNPSAINVLTDVTDTELVYQTTRRNGVDMDLVVRRHDDGSERVMYDGGGYIDHSLLNHSGTALAFSRLSQQPASTVIAMTGSDGGVAHHAGYDLTDPEEHSYHQIIGFSPDDRRLVISSNRDRDMSCLVEIDLATGTWTTLVSDDKHDLSGYVSPDGSTLLVGTMVDGALHLSLHEPDGTWRADVDMPEGNGSPIWSPDGRDLVISWSTPNRPASIYRVDVHTGHSTLVIAPELGVLEDALRSCQVDLIPTDDGEHIPTFIYEPTEPSGASVIHIHGGPESAATRIFNPTIQALVLSGFTVVVPNVRGSATYGKRWVSLDDGPLRLDSVGDLRAIHRWLPSQGLQVDRAALWGGSYGGYMVLAGVSMQPELWAAGVDIVGMSSLVTFLENTSDYRRVYREREYGYLATDRAMLEKASPITYLDDIVAPLFVIHGANDPRVPLSEAEQIHAALSAKGIPCELRVYHDEGHGLAKRSNRLDAYPAAIEFLRTRLGLDSQ
ncbi:S9 family peptidase [Devriesea agamarum]|uniref:S9 family peptidase n=1 Tax=Devriesea agamarum TaxID=472569 RepID=UPI000A5FBED3|nr:alpha/beta fold hydrolase [Devriesea agamarum]